MFDDGMVGKWFGISFVIKIYLVRISCIMFDELNFFVDMVVMYFFMLINSNIMVSWIKC